MKNTRTQPN